YLPLIALLGIPAAQLQNQNITVTLAVERMSRPTASVFKVFACILGILVSLGFTWFGFAEAVDSMRIGATAGFTDLIVWPVYFVVPVVFGLLAILYVLQIVATVRTGDPDVDLETGQPETEDSAIDRGPTGELV